jgi:hypothetical protein
MVVWCKSDYYMSNANRNKGYYWTKLKDDGECTYLDAISYFDGIEWHDMGNGIVSQLPDSAFAEIDERPIIRHTQLPEVFHIKKGMGFDRHLLENYYVALPVLSMPNVETVKWVAMKKGASIGISNRIIDPTIGYFLHESPEKLKDL